MGDNSNDDDDEDNDAEDDDTSSSGSSDHESLSNTEEAQQTSTDLVTAENVSVTLVKDENQPAIIRRPVLVCGVCLESHQSDHDEILECDNCGITVHEGCYGEMNNDIEDDKSDSDAPTEPWFCELCKANVPSSPFCELCPNTGGIYKQTDTGKWVHLVCALYTPDVGFRNLNRFQAVVLEDIRNHMWGSRDCQICANQDFSRTGVCIGCDAGLCRTTFHVTCAQMNGFLSDIPDRTDQGEQGDTPDLLYAHCKLHSVRHEVKKRKSSWTAFESRLSKFKRNEIDKERIDTALTSERRRYADYRLSVSVGKYGNEEPRLLSSCPEACVMLARKAEMLGVTLKRDYNLNDAVVSGKLSKIDTHYTPDSVAHFFKRESDIRELTKARRTYEPTLENLRSTQKHLTNETQSLQEKFDKIIDQKVRLEAAHKSLNKTLNCLSAKALPLPSFLNKKKQNKCKEKLNEASQLLNTVINKCAKCRSVEDQHLLTRCGTCRKYYHLKCVDPPLTRMPKSSGTYVWQCTECDSSDESSDAEEINSKRTRTKKEPEKFVPGGSKGQLNAENISNENVPKKKKKKYKKSLEKVKKIETEKPEKKPPHRPKKSKTPIKEISETCEICEQLGDSKSLVQCDSCKNFYHFKTCLDPPYTQSPKGKYYGWECEKCNDSDQ